MKKIFDRIPFWALMLAFFGVVFLFEMLSGCESSDTVTISKAELNSLKNIPQPEYPKPLPNIDINWSELEDVQIIVVDSCEFIIGYTSHANGGPIFAHRPRCKFCKQRQAHENK